MSSLFVCRRCRKKKLSLAGSHKKKLPLVATDQSASTRFQGSRPDSFWYISGCSTRAAEYLALSSQQLEKGLKKSQKFCRAKKLLNFSEQLYFPDEILFPYQKLWNNALGLVPITKSRVLK